MPEKTLKNNDARKLYIENPGNWITISEEKSVRISILKQTPFAKIEVKTYNNPMKDVYQVIAIRNYTIENLEFVFSAFPQDFDSIVQFLRENNV